MAGDKGRKPRNGKSKKQAQEPQSLEARLWDAANRMRSSVDPGQYKHVVLGLVFLRYVSDRFQERYRQLQADLANPDSYLFADGDPEVIQGTLEDRDAYTAEGVFWIPDGHRWDNLREAAQSPDIGMRIDALLDRGGLWR